VKRHLLLYGLGKLVKLFSPKAIRLFLVASAVGVSIGSLVHYNARASESALEAFPSLSAAKSLFLKEESDDDVHRFSMERVGPQSSYAVFNVSVVEQGGETKAFLQVQKAHQNEAVRLYEKELDPESFAQFWQALRQLEVAQLTNLSPYSENLDEVSGSVSQSQSALNPEAVQRVKRVPSSMTYRFQFQDGVHDYPTSFEVYAPDFIKDARYSKLCNLTERFVQETFGEAVK
jgi:hypothetical protein